MNLATRGSPESCLRILFETRHELQKTTELQNNNINQTLSFIYFSTRYIGGLYLNGFSRILFENPVFDTTSLFETVLRNQSDIFIFIDTTNGRGGVSLKCFYNFKRFLACMIFLTTRSVLVFLPGNLSMAWIILVSAFHLSCKFLARL